MKNMNNINLKPIIVLFILFISMFYLNWYYNMPEKRYHKDIINETISETDVKILQKEGTLKKSIDLSKGYVKKERTIEFFIVKGKYPFNSSKDTIYDSGVEYMYNKYN